MPTRQLCGGSAFLDSLAKREREVRSAHSCDWTHCLSAGGGWPVHTKRLIFIRLCLCSSIARRGSASRPLTRAAKRARTVLAPARGRQREFHARRLAGWVEWEGGQESHNDSHAGRQVACAKQHEAVRRCMVHARCGAHAPASPCSIRHSVSWSPSRQMSARHMGHVGSSCCLPARCQCRAISRANHACRLLTRAARGTHQLVMQLSQ